MSGKWDLPGICCAGVLSNCLTSIHSGCRFIGSIVALLSNRYLDTGGGMRDGFGNTYTCNYD